MCRRRAGRILDEAVAWCDKRDEALAAGAARVSGMQKAPGPSTDLDQGQTAS